MAKIWQVLLLLGIPLLIVIGYHHHQHVQQRYADFSITKQKVTQPTTLSIADQPVKLHHYHQTLTHGKLWSYLEVTSPVKQQLNPHLFKLYQSKTTTPNIYFSENIHVNAKNSRQLQPGRNRILMYTETATTAAKHHLVIVTHRQNHYQQMWLRQSF